MAYGGITPEYDGQSQIIVNPTRFGGLDLNRNCVCRSPGVQESTASLNQDHVQICDRMLEVLEIIFFINFQLALQIAPLATAWGFRLNLLWWLNNSCMTEPVVSLSFTFGPEEVYSLVIWKTCIWLWTTKIMSIHVTTLDRQLVTIPSIICPKAILGETSIQVGSKL